MGTLPPPTGSVSLGCSGYLQTVDYDALVEVARRRVVVLRVEVRASHFVLNRGEYVTVIARGCTAAQVDNKTVEAIRAAFVIGAERCPAQDLEHAVRQLVAIGSAPRSRRCSCAMPPVVLRDLAGEVRVAADRSEAAGLIDAAFDQIRQAAGLHPAVLIHVADTLG